MVNDGSKDDTDGVCRSYGERITYVAQPNGGEGAARNGGIRAARGELLTFLDADDEYLPHMVSTLAALMADYPQAGAGSAAFIEQYGATRTRLPRAGRVLGRGIERGMVKDFFDACTRDILVWVGTIMVRREVFDRVGVFRQGMKLGTDLEMWTRIGGQFDWAFVDREVTVYHHDPGTSVTLVWPPPPAGLESLFTEQVMEKLIRPELWPSYRRFRRKRALATARHQFSVHPDIARRAMKLIRPAPMNLDWIMTGLLMRCPLWLGESLRTVKRWLKRGVQRGK